VTMAMSMLKSVQFGAKLALSDKVNVYSHERLFNCAGDLFCGN